MAVTKSPASRNLSPKSHRQGLQWGNRSASARLRHPQTHVGAGNEWFFFHASKQLEILALLGTVAAAPLCIRPSDAHEVARQHEMHRGHPPWCQLLEGHGPGQHGLLRGAPGGQERRGRWLLACHGAQAPGEERQEGLDARLDAIAHGPQQRANRRRPAPADLDCQAGQGGIDAVVAQDLGVRELQGAQQGHGLRHLQSFQGKGAMQRLVSKRSRCSRTGEVCNEFKPSTIHAIGST